MQKDIHPDYQKVLFHDTNADVYFVIGSTLKPQQTREYEGVTYPYVSLDISSASHPFSLLDEAISAIASFFLPESSIYIVLSSIAKA